MSHLASLQTQVSDWLFPYLRTQEIHVLIIDDENSTGLKNFIYCHYYSGRMMYIR